MGVLWEVTHTMRCLVGVPWVVTYNRRVLSEVNLSEFLSWIPSQNADDLLALIPQIYTVEHRDQAAMLGARTFPLSIEINGESVRIPERPCFDVGCQRCEGDGGYKFQWCGPWTPPTAIVPVGGCPGRHRAAYYGWETEDATPGEGRD